MRKIKSSYNYGRTGKHGLKRRSKSNTNGAFGKPRKKRKICKRCGIRLSYEEERSGFDLCELCRDQNLKDGYPQNFCIETERRRRNERQKRYRNQV